MTAATEPITGTLLIGAGGIRGEEREKTVRIVEYAGFPRVAPQQQLRVGFTRNISTSGMCLGVDQPEPVGTLLRLCIRDVDGRCADAFVGRVVWTSADPNGGHRLGLELLTKRAAPGVVFCRPRCETTETAVGRSRA